MKFDTVMIAGGGIGGLCAAIALHQRGINARVYEAVPQVKPVGAGILLAPNALTILARLGLEQEALRCGLRLDELGVDCFGILDAQGRMLLPGFALQQMRQQFGYGLVALARAELHALLLAALPDGAVVLGKRIQQLRESATAVMLSFDDGSTVQETVLIGADGLRSVVRQHLFPQVSPQYSGQTSYRGMLDWPLAKLGEVPCAEIWGAQLRVGYTPVSATRVYWYATRLAPQGEATVDMAQTKIALLERAADMPELVQQLIAATPDDLVLRTDISDLPKLPSWHRGRIVLLGDAAHAMTPNLGQGGCQAIEDGYALAQCLARATTLEDGFVAFERVRKARADQVVATARQLGSIVHLGANWQRSLRNTALRMLPTRLLGRQTSTIYVVGY